MPLAMLFAFIPVIDDPLPEKKPALTKLAPVICELAPDNAIFPLAANVNPANEVLTEVIFGCAAVVTVPAVVAVVAVPALVADPLKVAVMIFALKLPLVSLATTLFAVLVVVASTAHVLAVPPLNESPVIYVPLDKVWVVLAVIVPLPPREIAVPLTVNELLANLA